MADKAVVEFRLKNGLCHQCGTRIYEIKADGSVKPLTISGVVVEGRCLFCYRDESESVKSSEKKQTPGGDRKRRRSNSEESMAIPKSVKTEPTSPDCGEKIPKSQDVSVCGPETMASTAAASSIGTADCTIDTTDMAPQHRDATKFRICDMDNNVFVGEIKEGNKSRGRGIFKFVHKKGDNKGKETVYEGEFENGRMEGTGKSSDASGCVYEGTFHNGAAHGFGKCTWPQGWKYEGEWVKDLREGHGTLWQEVEGGEVYKGEWKKDKWHGKGELKFAGGGRYEGDFEAHKLSGFGRYEFADGSVYEGTFKNDLREGDGTMTYEDGVRYVGEWRNNWREGTGALYHNDDSVFRGTFRSDEKVTGFLYLSDGIVRRESYVDGELQR